MKCSYCNSDSACMKRSLTGNPSCKLCFFEHFENEIHQTITKENIFRPGETVAIGASGGKDSTVLIHVLKTLNERHNYKLNLILISIDEGIAGYRDDSLKTVHENKVEYGLPLSITSYKELYGWTMDEIVRQLGTKNNCTVCGVFRRQALDRAACQKRADKIATGHNADDMAETVLMNILRGDYNRMMRCTSTITDNTLMDQNTNPNYLTDSQVDNHSHCDTINKHDNNNNSNSNNCTCSAAKNSSGRINANESSCHNQISTTEDGNCSSTVNDDDYYILPRCKPLKYCYQKEIVMYAHFKRLTYFATECTYAPNSFRGHVRNLLKRLERASPQSILNIIKSGEEISKPSTMPINSVDLNNNNKMANKNDKRSLSQNFKSQPSLQKCIKCSYLSSQSVCKACLLLEGLNKGMPLLGIGKTEKIRRNHLE